LFELFRQLQVGRRLRRQLQQKLAAVSVQADVLEEPHRSGGEVRAAVADKRDRAAAEIQRPAATVADQLDAVGIAVRLVSWNRGGQRRYDGLRVFLQQLGQKVEGRGIDLRLVALQVDDDVRIQRPGDLGNSVGAGRV